MTYALTVEGSSWTQTGQELDFTKFSFTGASLSPPSGDVYTLTNGTDTVTITVAGGASGTIEIASDGHGGTLVYDPPTTENAGTMTVSDGAVMPLGVDLGNDQINFASGQVLTQSYGVNVTDYQNPNVNEIASVSIGGPGNDNFVFHPGIGADTIVNFNPQLDTIELDHFANVQTIQELASLITTDAHGDAVIDLGHNDSITLPGMNAAQLHAVLQSVVHLH